MCIRIEIKYYTNIPTDLEIIQVKSIGDAGTCIKHSHGPHETTPITLKALL